MPGPDLQRRVDALEIRRDAVRRDELVLIQAEARGLAAIGVEQAPGRVGIVQAVIRDFDRRVRRTVSTT